MPSILITFPVALREYRDKHNLKEKRVYNCSQFKGSVYLGGEAKRQEPEVAVTSHPVRNREQ